MDFQVKVRDGPARIGQCTFNKETIVTPNILFLQTSRCNAPTFSDILLTNRTLRTKKPTIQIGESIFSPKKNKAQKNLCLQDYQIYPKDVTTELHLSAYLQNKNTECCVIPGKVDLISEQVTKNDANLFIITNAVQLYSHQSSFVEFITGLRQKIGYTKMIYLPCVGDPTSISLLTYMGVDFFDSFSAMMAARNEIFLFPTGFYRKNQLPEIPCCCPTCVTKDDVSSMGIGEILQHNYAMLFSELKLVRNAIVTGSLRELVEVRVRTRPHLAALLHILDLHHYKFLEERTPVVRKTSLIATTKDSLLRPEIRRFQDRVIQRFEKPASTKILLLLPCSAKKPYSFSKSHKLFRECFLNLANPFVVHEVILTSPLGLVPRELELTYPASSYDIAVTGHWDEDEKKMIRALLQGYLKKNTYDATIIHLPPAMQTFVSDLLNQPQTTCRDSPTSDASLTALSNVLQELTKSYDRVKLQRRVYENITSLASYQFGPALAKLLMKDCTISGKYPYQKIMDKTMQLGMLTEERGLLSLTMDGANRLVEAEQYWVEIYDDFTVKGSIFAPGVKDADDSIRIGDEVLVKKDNRLCGVGVALMSGTEMIQSSHGEAVKIRHHT
ncbi:MAG TPA: archaeosine synthase subunit alpha [Candidatus Thermoplasmatota archaeon]|nr:archaeosine synthase subunit alpha [Candidatus Thermoplasmatota archaeon]